MGWRTVRRTHDTVGRNVGAGGPVRFLRRVTSSRGHSHGGIPMLVRSALALVMLLAMSGSAQAQHGGGVPQSRTAPAEAAQFAFLIGQWELAVHPAASNLAQKIHGVPKLVGTWKAWRAFDGFGVEDEMRITDESGIRARCRTRCGTTTPRRSAGALVARRVSRRVHDVRCAVARRRDDRHVARHRRRGKALPLARSIHRHHSDAASAFARTARPTTA